MTPPQVPPNTYQSSHAWVHGEAMEGVYCVTNSPLWQVMEFKAWFLTFLQRFFILRLAIIYLLVSLPPIVYSEKLSTVSHQQRHYKQLPPSLIDPTPHHGSGINKPGHQGEVCISGLPGHYPTDWGGNLLIATVVDGLTVPSEILQSLPATAVELRGSSQV